MFLDKLKSFFRKNDGKEKLKIEYASPRNEYYGRVSDRYGTLQMLLLVLLTVFVLVALLINSEWISYENFYFFVSDFGSYLTDGDSDIEGIIYNTDSFSDFEIYGNKIAVAGTSGMTLYTSSGREVFTDSDVIGDPELEMSKRYMLLYDAGGKEYRIYNLFTEVYSETIDFPIYGSTVADNGSYAIITGDGQHITCVKIYNRRFEEIQTIGRASYITGVSMTPSGDKTAVLSYSQKNGKFITHLYLTKTNKSEPYAEITLKDSFPLYCSYTERGYINLVCDDRIVSFDSYGKQVNEYIIQDGYSVLKAECNESGSAVVLTRENEKTVLVFDKGGKLTYNNILNESIESISLYEKYIFIMSPYKIIRIDIQSGKKVTADKGINSKARMLIRDEDEVYLCMDSSIKYIKID